MASNALPDVIILNGPSSSGKSSIARHLQEALPELFLNFSIDTILYQLPPSDLSHMKEGRSIERRGYSYDKLVAGYHAAAAALLATGNRLILDNAITKDEWRADLQQKTQGYRTFWVEIVCSSAELTRREQKRGDRALGTAEREARLLDTGLSYDVTVDTTEIQPAEAARHVLAAITREH